MEDAEELDRYGFVNGVQIELGRFTYGFSSVKLLSYDSVDTKLKIGSFCSLGLNLTILTSGEHPTKYISTYPFGHPKFVEKIGGDSNCWKSFSKGDVEIGNDVWVGFGVTILSGVNIGSGSVIAANSTVTKNVEPYSVVGGNPARLIRKRFDDKVIDLLLILKWWELELKDIKEISITLSKTIPCVEKIEELINKYRNQQ